MKHTPFTSKYFILFLVPFALILVIWGLSESSEYIMFRMNSARTEATVVEAYIPYDYSERIYNCHVKIEYKVNGRIYNSYILYYDRGSDLRSKQYKGEKVSVLYHTQKPELTGNFVEKPMKGAVLIQLGIASAIVCVILYKRNIRYDDIIRNGITLDAVVTDIESDDPVMKNMAVNAAEIIITQGMSNPSPEDNEKGYSIICEWENPVSGQVHKFRSKAIDAFLTPYIGNKITVYVDPNDYSKYWVDIDSLLKQPMSMKPKPYTYERKQ